MSDYMDHYHCDKCGEHLVAPQKHVCMYGVYCGDNVFFLMRFGQPIRTRMRQFKRAWWKTMAGAQKAADKLNAALNG